MKNITLKNVPHVLHLKLKTQAKAHGRSLSQEILATLESILRATRLSKEAIGRHARMVRKSMSIYITQKDLNELKKAGRA